MALVIHLPVIRFPALRQVDAVMPLVGHAVRQVVAPVDGEVRVSRAVYVTGPVVTPVGGRLHESFERSYWSRHAARLARIGG